MEDRTEIRNTTFQVTANEDDEMPTKMMKRERWKDMLYCSV